MKKKSTDTRIKPAQAMQGQGFSQPAPFIITEEPKG